MKYCHPKLASAGVIATFSVVTLVGTNKHFWRRCRGRLRVEYIDKVVNKIEIGIRMLNRLTFLQGGTIATEDLQAKDQPC